MASIRTTFTLDDELAAQARKFEVNISAAARDGVTAAVKAAQGKGDRDAYLLHPERQDPFWNEAEVWGEE